MENIFNKEYENAESKNKKLAVILHKKFCNEKYTDRCSWYYEYDIDNQKIDWNGNEHKRYLDKANKILEKTEDMELIKEIISCLYL